LLSTEEIRKLPDALPVLHSWVRGTLVGLALGIVAVFTIAFQLNPYQDDGTPRSTGTHQQMGLPPCTFQEVTNVPCPACGMTTSFALLVRGDVVNSLRANAAGTLLALGCLAFLPWSLVSVWRGRTLFIRSLERALLVCVLCLFTLMMLRWIVVVGWTWWSGTAIRI
jgi:hypothetical protein